jgi:TIR domain
MEAIIQVNAGSLNECRIVADVAVADPVHIGISADLDMSAERLAAGAYQVLLGRFRTLAATGAAPLPQLCRPARLLNCRARSQPASFSLLVLVLGPGLASANLTSLATSWLLRPGSAVLAVLPVAGRPSLSLPPSLRRINAVNASIGVDAVVDAIEVAASLQERRLFISYRRNDAHAISEQLFDAFSHAGWRVYLDRFSGTPGQFFPREIVEELAEKGAVLVVESPNLRQSTWTLLEVAVGSSLQTGSLSKIGGTSASS